MFSTKSHVTYVQMFHNPATEAELKLTTIAEYKPNYWYFMAPLYVADDGQIQMLERRLLSKSPKRSANVWCYQQPRPSTFHAARLYELATVDLSISDTKCWNTTQMSPVAPMYCTSIPSYHLHIHRNSKLSFDNVSQYSTVILFIVPKIQIKLLYDLLPKAE